MKPVQSGQPPVTLKSEGEKTAPQQLRAKWIGSNLGRYPSLSHNETYIRPGAKSIKEGLT